MTLDGCGNEDYVGVVAGRKQVDRRLWPSYRSSDTSPLVGFLRHRLGVHSPLRRVQSHRCALRRHVILTSRRRFVCR